MAVISSNPRSHKFKCPKDFLVAAKKGIRNQFTHPVREGTYPRSGFEHPTYAVGDILEFNIEKRGLTLFNKESNFEVTAIELGRDKNTNKWLWIIKFIKL